MREAVLTVEKKKSYLAKEPGVRTKLFIADETIGLGKIDLLERLGEVGSISAAARQMGMSYKRAWFLLNSMQSGFREPLFVAKRGGSHRGGTTLTPLGADLIGVTDRMLKQLMRSLSKFWHGCAPSSLKGKNPKI